MHRRSAFVVRISRRDLPRPRFLDSSALRWVGYDARRAWLYAEFHADRERPAHVYRYYDVPPTVHDALLRAPSHGIFMNLMVKPMYDYDEVEVAG